MAKSKWHHVRSRLPLVEEWAKKGLTESQISTNLGIARSTLSAFKIRYPEFLEALSRGREFAVAELENALYRRAISYDYETTRVSVRMINGVEVRYTEKTRKHLPADVGACIILRKNKDRKNWSDNPDKRDLEREIFAFRKKLEMARLYGDESQ